MSCLLHHISPAHTTRDSVFCAQGRLFWHCAQAVSFLYSSGQIVSLFDDAYNLLAWVAMSACSSASVIGLCAYTLFVLQAMDKLMPGFDGEIAKLAQRVLVNPRHIDWHTGVLATKVTPGTSPHVVTRLQLKLLAYLNYLFITCIPGQLPATV